MSEAILNAAADYRATIKRMEEAGAALGEHDAKRKALVDEFHAAEDANGAAWQALQKAASV